MPKEIKDPLRLRMQLLKPGRRERAIYEFIIRYKQQHDGNSPTNREIGAAIGVSSKSLIYWYLKRMEQAGLIERGGPSNSSRSIEVVGGSWQFSSAPQGCEFLRGQYNQTGPQ